MTVLANACKQNNLGVVKSLLNRASVDIDFNLKDRYGDTCLMHAVRTSNTELVQLLVNTMQRLSIDIDVRNNIDITPFLEAKRLGFDDIANILTQDGHACQSLMICPLIFDEYKEDIYNAAISAQDKDCRSSKALRYNNWQSRKKVSTNRRIKSAHERRSDSARSNSRGREVKGFYSDSETSQREQGKGRGEVEGSIKLFVSKNSLQNPLGNENKQKDTIILHNRPVLPQRESEGKSSDSRNRRNEINFEKNIMCKKEIANVSERTEPSIHVQISPNETDPSVDNEKSQFEISVDSVRNGNDTQESQEQADNDAVKSKSTWLKRLQKRAPMWKRRLQLRDNKDGLESELGNEHCYEDRNVEMYRQSTFSSGAMRLLLIDKTNTPSTLRRCSSNLSVYFNDSQHSMPISRPGSAYYVQEKSEYIIRNSHKHPVTQMPVRARIAYEEIFKLCPEMKDDKERKWYSDIRWMLALKAHQNNGTYLPAQPQRNIQDSADSDYRNDSEGSRIGRRASLYDMRRPMIKKRHTTLSPTVLKELNED